MQSLDEVFGPRGPLARSLPGFTPRRSQLAMAGRVALALENRAPLVVEAGTGTGKTFAYLVPALLSGRRVLISTGTRTLQDQLFNKDLPLLAGAIGVPARVALLKGRSNYLCSYRLAQLGQAAGQRSLVAPKDRTLARVERWALSTRSGDLAEVPNLGDSHPLWPQVTSTRENCLGSRCSHIGRCHVVEARKRAIEADVVIVNHHLLLADLALKEDGFGDLLGAADAVIITRGTCPGPTTAETIATPLLVVGAGKDRICLTPQTRAFASRLPHADYVEIKDAEHEILMERNPIRAEFWAAFDAFIQKHRASD